MATTGPFAASAALTATPQLAEKRRPPTSTERATGIACGPVDISLDNWIYWYATSGPMTFLTASGLTPDDDDETQLSHAIRSQAVNYVATVGGTANALTATLDPAPASYAALAGVPLRLKIAETNTGAVTLNLNSLGAVAITTVRGTALKRLDLPAGSIVTVIGTGTGFAMAGVAYSEVPTTVYADLTFYVRPDGDDTNPGDTDSAAGAWLTMQGAVNNIAQRYAANAYTATVSIGDGTYTAFEARRAPMNIVFEGDTATPTNVEITADLNGGITCDVAGGSNVTIKGARLENSNTTAGYAAVVSSSSTLVLEDINWGFAKSASVVSQTNSTLTLSGDHVIGTDPGNKSWFARAQSLGLIQAATAGWALDVANAFNVSAGFFGASGNSFVDLTSASFTNGTTAVGPRYEVQSGGIIETDGAGATFLPGTTAGSATTGGGYY